MDIAVHATQAPHFSHSAASVLVDLHGIIRSASQRMARLCGASMEKLHGKALCDYLPGFPIRPGTPGYNLAFVTFWQHRGIWHQKLASDAGQLEISVQSVHPGDEALILVGIRQSGVMRELPDDSANLIATVKPSHHAVMITDTQGIITYVNAAFEIQSGYSAEEAVGQPASLLKSGLHKQDFYDELWRKLKNNEPFHGIFTNRRKSGLIYHEEKFIRPFVDSNGRATHFISLSHPLSASVEAEMLRLEQQAHQDPLTGLPNRNLFFDRLNQHCSHSLRRNTRFAVAYLDLDDFKAINDHWGHNAGDAVIKETARRIAASIRDEDTAARLGGDEFALILSDIGDETDIRRVLHKLLWATAQDITYKKFQLHIGISIGVSIYPQCGDTPELLLQNADEAMYACKNQGGNGIRFFQIPDDGHESVDSQPAARSALT